MRVVAAVLKNQDRWLVALRPAHKRHGGLWEFPGGKVHPHESDSEAIARELAEELSVRVVGASAPLYEVGDEAGVNLVFLEVVISGDPVAEEHDELRWASLDDLTSIDLAPLDRRFVKEFLSLGEF